MPKRKKTSSQFDKKVPFILKGWGISSSWAPLQTPAGADEEICLTPTGNRLLKIMKAGNKAFRQKVSMQSDLIKTNLTLGSGSVLMLISQNNILNIVCTKEQFDRSKVSRVRTSPYKLNPTWRKNDLRIRPEGVGVRGQPDNQWTLAYVLTSFPQADISL